MSPKDWYLCHENRTTVALYCEKRWATLDLAQARELTEQLRGFIVRAEAAEAAARMDVQMVPA